MRLVFLCGILLGGGGVGFAVARGHLVGKAAAIATVGFVVAWISLAGLRIGDPEALVDVVLSAASPGGLLDKFADAIGFANTAVGLALGFVMGVLLVQWDA